VHDDKRYCIPGSTAPRRPVTLQTFEISTSNIYPEDMKRSSSPPLGLSTDQTCPVRLMSGPRCRGCRAKCIVSNRLIGTMVGFFIKLFQVLPPKTLVDNTHWVTCQNKRPPQKITSFVSHPTFRIFSMLIQACVGGGR
jgi:hypothetical protein